MGDNHIRRARLDAKRGKIFTRLIKGSTIAAKTGGGGDPDAICNPASAELSQPPKPRTCPPTTLSAIQRGTGELEGVTYEEITYGGYGPGGVAIIVDVLTATTVNRPSASRPRLPRTAATWVPKCSRWMFTKKGVIAIARSLPAKDKLT
jgi:transcriptional/translational regulatory protein YebC/TACO1